LVDQGLADKWDRIFKERSEVLKALEQARNAGIIGHSLDAKVMFEPRNGDQSSILRQLVESDQTRLQDLLIVSQATVAHASGSAVEVSGYDTNLLNCRIMVNKADGAKCERCWKYDTEVGKDPTHPSVCARCAKVLRAGAGA
jgi:isoleucyl-tRNA synthetase